MHIIVHMVLNIIKVQFRQVFHGMNYMDILIMIVFICWKEMLFQVC